MVKQINSKKAFLISGISSFTFACLAMYKAIILYFINQALEDTFVGGNTSDISITLWFLICGIMLFTTFLFFFFFKIKDLNSQKTILSGVLISWVFITLLLIIIYREHFFLVIISSIPIVICFIAMKNLKSDIKNRLKEKGLSEKEIHLLQLLAGIKKK